jgi:hypothetical protein
MNAHTENVAIETGLVGGKTLTQYMASCEVSIPSDGKIGWKFEICRPKTATHTSLELAGRSGHADTLAKVVDQLARSIVSRANAVKTEGSRVRESRQGNVDAAAIRARLVEWLAGGDESLLAG